MNLIVRPQAEAGDFLNSLRWAGSDLEASYFGSRTALSGNDPLSWAEWAMNTYPSPLRIAGTAPLNFQEQSKKEDFPGASQYFCPQGTTPDPTWPRGYWDRLTGAKCLDANGNRVPAIMGSDGGTKEEYESGGSTGNPLFDPFYQYQKGADKYFVRFALVLVALVLIGVGAYSFVK